MLYVMLLGSMALSGLTMAAYTLAFRTDLPKIRPAKRRKLGGWKLYSQVAINSMVPPVVILGTCWLFYDVLFVDGEVGVLRVLAEGLAIVLVYDFLYYLAHRFLFHGPLMHRFHAVHHVAKHPIAIDSLYVHPAETAVGLVLLMGSTALVALVSPVHVVSFAAMFAVYSLMNIAIHSGLDLWWLGPFNHMAKKHDRHHVSMKAGNYASITPLFDVVFRTAE